MLDEVFIDTRIGDGMPVIARGTFEPTRDPATAEFWGTTVFWPTGAKVDPGQLTREERTRIEDELFEQWGRL